MFVATQIFFCRDNHIFVATKDVLCHDKHMFVVTQQTCVCRDKLMFVTTKLLSWHKWHVWQLPPMIIKLYCTALFCNQGWYISTKHSQGSQKHWSAFSIYFNLILILKQIKTIQIFTKTKHSHTHSMYSTKVITHQHSYLVLVKWV